MTDKITEEQLITAFHMMWGKFPEPVMLIHRNRTVLAINACCEAFGGIVPGKKCNEVSPESHKGCKANEALDRNEARTVNTKFGEKLITGYWIPVTGISDYFTHFSIGLAEAMKAEQVVPNSPIDRSRD